MSQVLNLGVLPEGWYSVGVKASSSFDANFNMHAYSYDSPIHFHTNGNQVSTELYNMYVEPNAGEMTDGEFTSDASSESSPTGEPVSEPSDGGADC